MNRGFWDTLERPFFVLAPMADVTDAAFRRIIAKYGKPDVIWTEFVSADGLLSPGRDVLLRDLAYSETERPIVAQLFTGSPERMEEAAAMVAELGLDGLDINMGCPDRSVEKQGAGAALMKDPSRAVEIIRAAQSGVEKAGNTIPVSVKTRIGYNKNELATWLLALLSAEPAVVSIHARTRKEMSDVPAHWDEVARAVKMRDALSSGSYIVGNGDALNLSDSLLKARESGADGVMLGRAIFGNPWLFRDLHHSKAGREVDARIPTLAERLRVLAEHVWLYEGLLGDVKSFAIMKKHFKAYVNGFSGAYELRLELMQTKTAAEVVAVLEAYLLKNKGI